MCLLAHRFIFSGHKRPVFRRAADESGKYDGVGSGPCPDEGGSCIRSISTALLPSDCRRQQQDSSEIFSFGSGSGFVAVRVWKCASSFFIQGQIFIFTDGVGREVVVISISNTQVKFSATFGLSVACSATIVSVAVVAATRWNTFLQR